MSPQPPLVSMNKTKNKALPKVSPTENTNPKPELTVGETIDYLKQSENLADKFSKLKCLINSQNVHLIKDSFYQDAANELSQIQQKTLNSHGFNVVIIGAGATGLFLASILKYALAEDVNILVIDNRSIYKNTRKNFSRNWLTHIPTSIIQKFMPPTISEFFECFGKNGLIGVPINIIETILMLSCKDQGVKFYFSSDVDLKALNSKYIDCFFDATAGHLNSKHQKALKHQSSKIYIPNQNMSFISSGINQLNNFSDAEECSLEIILKSSGPFYYPFIEGCKINTHMFKLTGIPIGFMKKVRAFIRLHNTFNKFFIWDGTLKDEINEGLILINLTNAEYKTLSLYLENKIELNAFLLTNVDYLSFLSEPTISLLKLLSELDCDNKVYAETPFTYSPYVNLNAGDEQFNRKPIFPIGDSLFCGNPKVGNGLSQHLHLLNELLIGIIASRKSRS